MVAALDPQLAAAVGFYVVTDILPCIAASSRHLDECERGALAQVSGSSFPWLCFVATWVDVVSSHVRDDAP